PYLPGPHVIARGKLLIGAAPQRPQARFGDGADALDKIGVVRSALRSILLAPNLLSEVGYLLSKIFDAGGRGKHRSACRSLAVSGWQRLQKRQTTRIQAGRDHHLSRTPFNFKIKAGALFCSDIREMVERLEKSLSMGGPVSDVTWSSFRPAVFGLEDP